MSKTEKRIDKGIEITLMASMALVTLGAFIQCMQVMILTGSL